MPSTQSFKKFPPFSDDLPVADLPRISLGKLTFADPSESEKLFEACSSQGFFLLDIQDTSDGKEFLKDTEAIFEISRELHDLDMDEKMKFKYQPPGCLFGFKPEGALKVESGKPDRFEFYNVGQDDMLGTSSPRSNPIPIDSKREIFKPWFKRADTIATLILSHLDTALRLKPGTLESRQRQSEVSGTALRLLKYRPQPVNDRRTSLLGHTDIGTMTIIFTILGGLQILPPGLENIDENWRYVKPQPGCAIINLGDAMVYLSGGILRSNMHRVTYAPGEQANFDRYSIAYLVRPQHEVRMQNLIQAELGSTTDSDAQQHDEDNEPSYKDWEMKKAVAIMSGKNIMQSQGGRKPVQIAA